VFLIAFIATAAASIGAVAIFRSEGAQVTLASAVFEFGLALTVILWIRALHRPAMPALGPPARPGREVLAGAVGGVLIRVVAFAAALLVVMLTEIFTNQAPSVPEQVPSELSGLAQLLLGAVVVVGAPLGEELFFRGFLFRGLRARRGFWVAALVSSVAFAVVHVVEGNWFLVPVMFAVGMCLAYLYEREGRILVPIAAHAMFNLIGMAFIVWG
jgi:membrane protease YdiL (CAAX protease family)